MKQSRKKLVPTHSGARREHFLQRQKLIAENNVSVIEIAGTVPARKSKSKRRRKK